MRAAGLLLGIVWIGACSSPDSAQAPPQVLAPLATSDPCTQLLARLPCVSPPLEMPIAKSLDPFPVEVQDWLHKNLADTGIYAPVGQWPGPEGKLLWLIEQITSQGSFYYAVLSDSTCAIADTAVWAFQRVLPDQLEEARARLAPTGECQIQYEKRSTDFSQEQPRIVTTQSQARYAVDWSASRFRRL